jgi:hypothetical protein
LTDNETIRRALEEGYKDRAGKTSNRGITTVLHQKERTGESSADDEKGRDIRVPHPNLDF